MPTEAFSIWFDTLPSQRQIPARLHTSDGYCCLGWATEVVFGADAWEIMETGYKTFNVLGVNSNTVFYTAMPPDNVNAALGFDIKTTAAYVASSDRCDIQNGDMGLAAFLSAYNDAGYSFDFIRRIALAKILEAERLAAVEV